MTHTPPTRVLFIGGLGRSGSTVLELLLARAPGVVAVGEVRHLWARGLRDGELCACGEPFGRCPFWSAVGDAAFGGWHRLDPDNAVACARGADRHRQLLPDPRGGRRRRRMAYADMLGRLFAGIREVSGADVIVDSSKDPPHGFVLAGMPEIDLRAIHLVRDSRGVAHSWMKSVHRPESAGTDVMSRMSAPRTALMWLDANLLTEALGCRRVPVLRVRYEDVIARPDHELARIGNLAGMPMTAAETAHCGYHGVAGNPVRFDSAPLRLRLDDAWRQELSARNRRIVTGLTAVLLRRYGYPLRVGLAPGGHHSDNRTSRHNNVTGFEVGGRSGGQSR